MAKVNPIQVQKYLKGLNYPARKQDIIRKAEEQGADENIRSVLRRLPEGEFRTPADVSQAVGRIT